MAQLDPVIFRELPVIEKIIRDETWLEGERRGCFVPPGDPVVLENVCRVILRIGRELREAVQAQVDGCAADGYRQEPGAQSSQAA